MKLKLTLGLVKSIRKMTFQPLRLSGGDTRISPIDEKQSLSQRDRPYRLRYSGYFFFILQEKLMFTLLTTVMFLPQYEAMFGWLLTGDYGSEF